MRTRRRFDRSRPLAVALMVVLAIGPVACGPAGQREASSSPSVSERDGRFAVLVMSKTAGHRHSSIEPGVESIRGLGAEHGFRVDATEDASAFSTANLARYDVVVFLNTTGSILDQRQQDALVRFVRGGNGFVGIHSATDTHYDWPWYGELVGAYFKNHPRRQDAVIHVVDRSQPSTRSLPARWERFDEWYNYREPLDDDIRILAVLDPASYRGSEMGELHPIAWQREFEGGRSWYTGGGHTEASFAEPLFLEHLLGGIEWAAGVSQ